LELFVSFIGLELKGFASEDELIDYIRRTYSDDYLDYIFNVVGVVFDPAHTYESKLPDDVTYWIRMGGNWDTEKTYADKSFDTGPNFNYGKDCTCYRSP
jgi:hypothetical protein